MLLRFIALGILGGIIGFTVSLAANFDAGPALTGTVGTIAAYGIMRAIEDVRNK